MARARGKDLLKHATGWASDDVRVPPMARAMILRLLLPHEQHCRMCAVLRVAWWYFALKVAFITGLVAAEHLR